MTVDCVKLTVKNNHRVLHVVYIFYLDYKYTENTIVL